MRIQPAENKFADRARGVPAKPPVGQTPPVGNGAHSAPSQPFAECAPEIVGPGNAGTDNGAEASLASRASAPAVPRVPEFRGTTILDIDEIVNRVLAAERVIQRISEPCPQGDDCAGDGKHTRVFDCEEGCGFRGCVACLMVHEAEPHVSDSDTAREMYRNQIARDRT